MNEKRSLEDNIRICDPANIDFKEPHQVLDHRFRVFHGKGIGTIRWQFEVISYSEELALWNSDIVGVRSPSTLLNDVFFYNGLNFVLRGGEEHRELKISQFHFRDEVIDPENPDHMISCVEYREHGSKNRPVDVIS